MTTATPATATGTTAAPAPRLPEAIAAGLSGADNALVERAHAFATQVYDGKLLGTGEPALDHALGIAASMAALRLDADARIAGLLFAVPTYVSGDVPSEKLRKDFGDAVAMLVEGITRLNSLRVVTRTASGGLRAGEKSAASQAEVLRKMLLAMVEDIGQLARALGLVAEVRGVISATRR